jgi:hypothetical protein
MLGDTLFTGRLLTPATWIRNFVRSHPDYKKDSVVSQTINYDLLVAVDEMYVLLRFSCFSLVYVKIPIANEVFVGHLTFFQLITGVETRIEAPFDF